MALSAGLLTGAETMPGIGGKVPQPMALSAGLLTGAETMPGIVTWITPRPIRKDGAGCVINREKRSFVKALRRECQPSPPAQCAHWAPSPEEEGFVRPAGGTGADWPGKAAIKGKTHPVRSGFS